MRIMRSACFNAYINNNDKISASDIEYAIKQEQFSFERTIAHEHYAVLAKVYQEKNLENDDLGQQVLYNTSVLEYNGDARWNYVNPVIIRSNLFKKAYNTLLSSS